MILNSLVLLLNSENCKFFWYKGEHFEEAFGKINPLRKVPVIDDNGYKLTERFDRIDYVFLKVFPSLIIMTSSVAILRYLARTRKIDDHWYSADVKLQAKVDEYLEWQHLNTRLFCAMYFRHKVC